MKTKTLITLITILLILSSCGYNHNFRQFYKHKMSKVDENHKQPARFFIKTVEAPFYGFIYLYGGLGAILDFTRWKKNFSSPPENKCLKKINENSYKILGINFKANNDIILMDPIKCEEDKDVKTFFSSFGIIKPKYQVDEGNTLIAQIGIVEFQKNFNKKEIEEFINLSAKIQSFKVNEINKNKDPRFSNASYKTVGFYKNNSIICNAFSISIQDNKAPNVPKEVTHLMQRDFYKTCYFKDYNTVVGAAVSYRVTPEISKSLTQDQIIKKLNNFLENFSFDNGEFLNKKMEITKTK